jgi:50S ribosomal subunit-associated GTPase HflX
MITGQRMPANLPPDAKAKWNEVTLTKNPETRLKLMGEFLSLVPKHKGTEKMCSQVKRQMAQIRDELEEKKKAAKRRGGPSYFVEKAGAAQIAVVGPTNAGRSSLLRAVTNSSVEPAPWPFSTRVPHRRRLLGREIGRVPGPQRREELGRHHHPRGSH